MPIAAPINHIIGREGVCSVCTDHDEALAERGEIITRVDRAWVLDDTNRVHSVFCPDVSFPARRREAESLRDASPADVVERAGDTVHDCIKGMVA